jgi:competence protein ComGC
MKPRLSNQRTQALTLVEVLVVIAVVIFLIGFILPALVAAKQKARRIDCMNNLKEIGVGFRLWEGNHNDKYPMQVSVTNGGAMELIGTGNAYVLWQTMFNELRSSKILHCPADTDHVAATNFTTGFSDANISYFVSPDAIETYPQMILDGDDNLLVDGKRVQSGILNL